MHFFIDQDQLTAQTEVNAYGPVSTDLTNRYNITSRFNLTNEAKAFACVSGQLIVQQSTVDPTLVNLILKPCFELDIPLNVGYYVYRGVLKNTLIDDNDCVLPQGTGVNQLIERIWENPPDDPSCGTLGYDTGEVDGDVNVEDIFNFLVAGIDPIYVNEGEWFGTFANTHDIGFEVILKTNRFPVDMDYVRSSGYEVNVTGLTGLELRSKREEILNFLDPAAFYGMHYMATVTYYDDAQSGDIQTTNVDPTSDRFIYTKLIDDFHTRNRLYLDIRSEKGYSYNFYQNYRVSAADDDNIRIRHEEDPVPLTPQEYETNGWPIVLIESEHEDGTINTVRIELRIDDNTEPIIYMHQYPYNDDEKIKHTDPNSKYISTQTLISDGTNPNLTEWTNTIQLRIPNTQSGTTRNYISNYVKMHYFRSVHNANDPDTVLLNEKYYDSAFCSIDIPTIGDSNAYLKHVESANPIFLREPNNDDGTGNFELTAASGAYWDDDRILFYSTVNYLDPADVSEKEYMPTNSQKLELDSSDYRLSEVYARHEVLCKEYITAAGTIRIPNINFYRSEEERSGITMNLKENAMFLGISIDQLNAVVNDTQLSEHHERFIFIEPSGTNPQETTPDTNGNTFRYNEYTLRLQGLDNNGDSTIVTPQFNSNDIILQSRDNQFFSSSDFAANETLTEGENRIEIHVQHDGCIRINDNLDFALALLYDMERVQYIYHDANGVETAIEGLSADGTTEEGLELVMANKMERRPGNRGRIDAVPAGFNLFINYANENVPGVSATNSYENDDGDVVTEGPPNYGTRRYNNLYKKRFMVRLVTESETAPNGNVTNFFRNTDLGMDLEFQATLRLYANLFLAGAVIGALIQIDHDIISQGFAYIKGSCYPSSEHVNGEALDTNYNAVLQEDVDFIEALNSFGISKFRIGNEFHQRSNNIYDDENFEDNRADIFRRDANCRRPSAGETPDCNLVNGVFTQVRVLNSLHSSHLHSTDIRLNDANCNN